MIKKFNEFEKTNEKSTYDYAFVVVYDLDSIASSEGFNTHGKALDFAYKTISEMSKRVRDLQIFRNGSGWHSTTQENYLLNYWKSSYWSAMAEKNPKLKVKEIL